MAHNSALLGGFLGGAVGGTAAVLLGLLGATDRDPPVTGLTPSLVDLAPVLERLNDLETAMREQPANVPTPVPAREPLPTDVQKLATKEDVAELAGRIELLAQRFAASAVAAEIEVRVPPQWQHLERLRELCQSDEKAAEAEVRLMTVPQVVERFGLPTRVTGAGHLWYEWPDTSGKVVGFIVKNGYVTDCYSKSRKRGG